MKSVIITVLLCPALFGGQSFVSNANLLALAEPNQVNATPTRTEVQLHNFGAPPSGTFTILGLSGTGILMERQSNGFLFITDQRDTTSICTIDPSAYAVLHVRIQRDPVNNIYSCEFWNWDSTNYVLQSFAITAQNTWSGSGGGIGTPTGQIVVDIGFLRVYTSLVALNSLIPTTFINDSDPNLVYELKFDGTLSDSSPNARDAHLSSGLATYVATPHQQSVSSFRVSGAPTFTPVIAMSAGRSNQIDGSFSYTLVDSTIAVSHFWQQLSGPTYAVWSSRTASTPTLTSTLFGDYLIQLTVSDGTTTAASTLHIGAVAQDVNHVVVPAQETFARAVFGDQIALGYNPWPYQDASNLSSSRVVAQQMGTPGSGATISADWNVPLAGTCSSPDGIAVTCPSGGLQAAFCGGFGNTSPSGGWYFIWYYQDPNNIGRIGRAYDAVGTCNTDTTLTLNGSNTLPYHGVSCTISNPCQYSRSVNVNGVTSGIGSYGYYDSANQFYGLWLRTGLTEFRDDARMLDDITMTAPAIDQGVLYEVLPRINPTRQYASRIALDDKAGDPNYLLTMRTVSQRYSDLFINGYAFSQGIPFGKFTIADPREWGAEYMDIGAHCAIETDSTWLTNCKTWLEDGYTNIWSPQVSGDGHWNQGLQGLGAGPVATFTNGSAIATTAGTFPTDICGVVSTSAGTVTVTNGNATVVGSGTHFTSGGIVMIIFGTFSGSYGKESYSVASIPDDTHIILNQRVHLDSASGLTFKLLSSGNLAGVPGYVASIVRVTDSSGNPIDQVNDPNWYACTRNSATQITLDMPFQTATTFGKYEFSNEYSLNAGSQPFMNGFVTGGLNMAVLSGTTHAAGMESLASGLYPYMSGAAYLPDTQGIAYAASFGSCTPLFSDGYNCGGGPQQTWMYGVELIHSLSNAYGAAPTGPKLTFGDKLYGTEWGNPAYGAVPYSNGSFVTDCGAGYFTVGINLKFSAQCFSLGSTASWPAARIGGVQPVQNRAVHVSFKLTSIPNAASVNVITTYPSGVNSTVNCTNPATCSVTVDDRQGDATISLTYLSAGNQALATSAGPVIVQ